tara:strand:+ start:29322 stop:30482 length:1161 start_codon:yes stop_codon:yes gene_type:complete
MEDAAVTDVGVTAGDSEVSRLSDFESKTNLSRFSEYLSFIDVLVLQFRFHVYTSRKYWGKFEAIALALVSASVVMGAWDYGIGELSSGGDWSRGGIFGEDSGFLHLKEWSIMLSLLSIMSWLAALILMWTRYPIMRENLVFLVVALFCVQLGHIHSHSNAPYFPVDSELSDWGGVAIGNMIMIFLSIFVVHRAVTETRDIHVEEKHAHPDPRLVEKAWRDHRLDAWTWSLAIWALMINIMSWSGAHAISQRPPIEDGIFGLSLVYVFSGVSSFFLLMHVVWYPHFMLGGGDHTIQSSRAREVAGIVTSSKEETLQGLCPVCGAETPVLKRPSGAIEVHCSDHECSGWGAPGDSCSSCGKALPMRLKCGKCGTSASVSSHFVKSDAW